MKKFRWLTAIILAILMAVMSPLQVLAAGQKQYISDISIGYGDDGKAALEKEGYTVWQNLNANDGGSGSAVWLGYKTTTDPNEAITDVALMNMKGGYSFDAYTQEIEDLNRRVSEQLASFKVTIEAFRANYQDGNIFAKEAYRLMNAFTDDESESKGIGEIFLDEATTEETLHRIFLEGNTDAIGAIEQALALACIETGDENVLTRIEDSEYPEKLDPQKSAARTALASAFADFHSTALSLQALAEEIENYEGGADAFFARETLSDAEGYSYLQQYSRYILLSETPFGDTGMSLFDFALLDEEIENEDGEILEDEYLEILAQSMTDGQLGIVANVGIMVILANAAAGEKASEAEESFAENASETLTPVSVYYGVDRQLFENTDGIALTSAALREKAAAEGNNFGKDANADEEQAKKLILAASAVGFAGFVTAAFGIKAIVEAHSVLAGENAAFWFSERSAFLNLDNLYVAAHTPTISVGGIIATAIGVIAIIAAVVLIVFILTNWIEKPVAPENIDYTEIPRVIVEKNDDSRDFIAYYAAKLAGASEDETDSTKLYGDLNALNGTDEWVGLYYSKNPDLGEPLTAELLVSSDGVLKASNKGKFAAVHMFGSTSAANLNQYNSDKNAKPVYLFLRTDAGALQQSGSIFSKGTVLSSIVSFVVGAGLATAVTFFAMKKKKTQPAK